MADMRLIDANALVHAWGERTEKLKIENEKGRITKPYMYLDAAIGNAVCEYLSSAPTIDAVEVVRCRKCMNWQKDWECTRGKPGDHYCTMIDLVTEPDFYCKHGAKMDGGADK